MFLVWYALLQALMALRQHWPPEVSENACHHQRLEQEMTDILY